MKYQVMRYFEYKHLPPRLQEVSKPFCDLAHLVSNALPYDPETSTALRKLLEAKDAAVRAALTPYTPSDPTGSE